MAVAAGVAGKLNHSSINSVKIFIVSVEKSFVTKQIKIVINIMLTN